MLVNYLHAFTFFRAGSNFFFGFANIVLYFNILMLQNSYSRPPLCGFAFRSFGIFLAASGLEADDPPSDESSEGQ